MERYIHEHGWSADTPEADAVQATMVHCRATCEDTPANAGGPWQVMDEPIPEVMFIKTPEMEANGEYVVRVTVYREKVT